MNFDIQILRDNWPDLWLGVRTTVTLFVLIMIICTPLSFLLAYARLSRVAWLRRCGAVYVNTVRALPLLVILFFTFYGLPAFGVYISPFAAALMGLTIVTTAFLSEDIRAGLSAVPRGQFEAAEALGLAPMRFLWRILIPQVLPILCAPFFTRAIVTVKATSIASMVAVAEITAQSMAGITTTYRAVEFLAFAAVSYLLLSTVLAVLQALTQRLVKLP